ncbi:hypothetical protein CLOP_g2643 [Closterium sp. NIES-67]|nr:hypothetical protein CLOP_g2643 [Closterium sp. NIES-67]
MTTRSRTHSVTEAAQEGVWGWPGAASARKRREAREQARGKEISGKARGLRERGVRPRGRDGEGETERGETERGETERGETERGETEREAVERRMAAATVIIAEETGRCVRRMWPKLSLMGGVVWSVDSEILVNGSGRRLSKMGWGLVLRRMKT